MSYIAVYILIPLAVRRCPLILVGSSHFFGSASAGANGLANVCISWPVYSPDLNPIKTVWNRMKDYVANNYPDKLSYDQL